MLLFIPPPPLVQVQFKGACSDEGNMCIVTEFAERGSLEDLVVGKGRHMDSLPPLPRMAADAVSGLANLHAANVLHRDIATRNCLVMGDYGVKVCDFGLSTLRPASALEGGMMADNNYGALRWMAPESLRAPHIFSKKTDTWMAGVMLWEIFSGCVPYPSVTHEQAAKIVVEGYIVVSCARFPYLS